MPVSISPAHIADQHWRAITAPDAEGSRQQRWPALRIAPLIVGAALASLGFRIAPEHIGSLLGALAIFAGLLFNVLVMLFTVRPEEDNDRMNRQAKLARRNVFYHTQYAILQAVVAILALSAMLIGTSGWSSAAPPLSLIEASEAILFAASFALHSVIFWALTDFLVTALLVLRGMDILLGRSFR